MKTSVLYSGDCLSIYLLEEIYKDPLDDRMNELTDELRKQYIIEKGFNQKGCNMNIDMWQFSFAIVTVFWD